MRRTNSYTATEGLPLDQKNFLGITLLFLLALYFTLGYLGHTYYPEGLLDPENLGFWINIVNYCFLGGIVLLNKHFMGWKWKDLGLAKPTTWWKPVVTTIAVFVVILLFANYLQPYILENFGPQQNLEHLQKLQENLPALIGSLILIWITAAFLEELVFRGFMINVMDSLLGSTIWSTVAAVIISSLIFGMIHAYQGITGILVTTFVGLIFGIGYILNGRRIWPLVFIHGLLDTLTLYSYYSA